MKPRTVLIATLGALFAGCGGKLLLQGEGGRVRLHAERLYHVCLTE